MTPPFLVLKHLRVLKSGHSVYDQEFHRGLNIIRGENGSGKSTIADFIFYVLGGEFDRWKAVAGTCEQVQAEVETRDGLVTIRRDVGTAQTRPYVFFGPLEEANKSAVDGWLGLPLRRVQDGTESFSQIMFRSIGIPEAPSLGGSNITMHQVMRLLYSDQRTPSAFLFRYEDFDRKEIRAAVGDLVCGLSIYEVFDIELTLRDLRKEFDEKSKELSYLFRSVPDDEKLFTVASINSRLAQLTADGINISDEIGRVDEFVDASTTGEFLQGRRSSLLELTSLKAKVEQGERKLRALTLDIEELTSFIEYLEELNDKLHRASDAADIIGSIEFTYCPACLTPLNDASDGKHCVVCGSESDPELERSRYLAAKLDVGIQLREAKQLLVDQSGEAARATSHTKAATTSYSKVMSEFVARYDLSISPRESFLAERHHRLGQLEREKSYLARLLERAEEIDALSQAKAGLQATISKLEDRLKALEASGYQRRSRALTLISRLAKTFLSNDLPRQREFANPTNVSVRFEDNSVTVDGELNFSDSSNVILKNSAVLSLFVAACLDEEFNHPRFILLDNIEDKGMEQERSHNFQKLIARSIADGKFECQAIVTTSMIAPDLDVAEYTVGPRYTHENRTLAGL